MQPRRPLFKLLYRGIDITPDVESHLLTCTYTDKIHGEADEIDVTVQDRSGIWRGAWCPEHGDKIELWIGYDGEQLVPCGAFEIDEPAARLGRGGDTLSFRGVSAPVTKSLRTTKTRGFEQQNLKQIAQKVAKEHGFTIVGTPPDISFERVTQRRERDLQFLSRMADAYGAYFAVKGTQLVFMKRAEAHQRPPSLVLAAESDAYISADLKLASHKTYSKAKATYFDGNKKKTIDVEVEDKSVKTGDTLRLDERVENEGQARARAKSELERENMKKKSGTILLVGAPLALAGQTIELAGDFGVWAGRYSIQSSRHHIARGQGYTTSIEIKGVE